MAKVSEQLDLLLEEMATWDKPEYVISSLTHLVDIHSELLTHSFTYEVLGRAYGLQDNKPLAAEIFEMALKLDPTRQQASDWYNQVRECEDVNYDEAHVPTYQLPDALRMADGRAVTDAAMWREERRPELLRLFEEHVYGIAPGRPENIAFEVTSVDERALDGQATRKRDRRLLYRPPRRSQDGHSPLPAQRPAETRAILPRPQLSGQPVHP